MREIDLMAVEAGKDEVKFSAFLERHELFILKTASKICRHYISKNDDEWSVAMVAFSDAVEKYDFERGSFIAFAERIIHQRLVDFFRVRGRHSVEIPVDFIEEEAIVLNNDSSLVLEIEAVTQILTEYGFSFMDLVDCSPKAEKTKKACAKAVKYILLNPLLIEEMRSSKQLPLKIIEKNAGVPRKILERHRKYLIAAIEILNEDYPYLSDYLSFIKEGSEL